MNNRNTISIFLGFVLVIVLIAAAGCDKKSGKAGAAPPAAKKIVFDPKNPCNLLTKEEVEAVMKQKILAPKLQDGDCVYDSEDQSRFSNLIIYVQNTVDAAGDIKWMHNRLQEGQEGGVKVLKKLDGIGDYAFIRNDENPSIWVQKESIYLQFVARGSKEGILSEDGMKTLVKQAMDKL